MAEHADILIINGGLGPTVDDLTSQALAQALNVSLTQHVDALQHLEKWCKARGTQLNTPNLKQAILPQGCKIIANRKGSAVGFQINHQGCEIYCTPGVPHELKTMLIEQIKPDIAKSIPDTLVCDVTRLQVFGLGESTLQKLVDDQLPDWPSDIELGFRAGMPLLEVKLTTNSVQGHTKKEYWRNKLATLLGDHLIAEIKEKPLSLAEHVLVALKKDNLKITTAESCTGGLVASLLTQVAGASQSFQAGFVTYSNEMKSSLLNVTKESLTKYGAVSKHVVIEMAQGALNKSSADFAIAITGIAGPDGGSEDKPIGTVWLAWGTKNELQTQCLLLPLNRVYFQKYVAAIALDLIRRLLINSEEVPAYITDRAIKTKH